MEKSNVWLSRNHDYYCNLKQKIGTLKRNPFPKRECRLTQIMTITETDWVLPVLPFISYSWLSLDLQNSYWFLLSLSCSQSVYWTVLWIPIGFQLILQGFLENQSFLLQAIIYFLLLSKNLGPLFLIFILQHWSEFQSSKN